MMKKFNVETTVIIVNYYTEDLLNRCLASLEKGDRPQSLEVIIIDNGSIADLLKRTKEKFKEQLNLTIITNKNNVGFARAVNQGLQRAKGDYIFLFNPDATLATPGGIQRLREVLDNHPDVGIVAPKIIYPDGTTQSEGERTPSFLSLIGSQLLGLRSHQWRRLQCRRRRRKSCSPHLRFVDWVTGAAMMVRRDVIAKAGGFNEEYWLYGEDLEFCHRVRKHGYLVAVIPTVVVIHDKGKAVEHYICRAYINSALGIYRFQRQIRGELYARACVLVLLLGVLIRALTAPLRRKPLNEYIQAARKIWHLLLRGITVVQGDTQCQYE